MYVEFELSYRDLLAYGDWYARRHPTGRTFLIGAGSSIALLGFFSSLSLDGGSLTRWTILPALAVLALTYAAFVVMPATLARRSRSVAMSRPITVELNAEGVVERTAAGHRLVRWFGLERVGRTSKYLFLCTDPSNAIIVPRRAFSTDDEWHRYSDYARQCWERALGRVPD